MRKEILDIFQDVEQVLSLKLSHGSDDDSSIQLYKPTKSPVQDLGYIS